MRKLATLLLGSLLIVPFAAQASPRVDGEAKLARMLEGRVAGEPVDCVQLRNIRSSRIIDRTAIVYDSGGTLYVNRPRSGSEGLTSWVTQVTKPTQSQLCSVDVVQLYDNATKAQTGMVFLGEFVPYRKAGR
jgi:hypothetical protein